MKSQTIWTQCGAKSNLKTIDIEACRVVESQHHSSTRKLVDSLEEHDVLEEAIESVKPLQLADPKLHFLLFTPFRYPPLKHGSRFGSVRHKGIWYGSLEERTAFAERAYYFFRFFHDMRGGFVIQTQLTLFWTHLFSKRAVDMTAGPFVKHRNVISAKDSYAQSQRCGEEMRNDYVDFLKFFSARDMQNGINVAVFSPKAFASSTVEEKNCHSWSCFVDPSRVEFRQQSFTMDERYMFKFSDFIINGKFPVPEES